MMFLYLLAALCLAGVLCAVGVVGQLDSESRLLLRPRTQAPGFKAKAVMDDKFIEVELESYKKAGSWVVLLFYPYDYTFVCPVRYSACCMLYSV
jgi:hypothetical protein